MNPRTAQAKLAKAKIRLSFDASRQNRYQNYLDEKKKAQILNALVRDQRNPRTFWTLYALYMIGLHAGARISEALGLTRSDVNFTNQTIRLHGKGGKTRILHMGQRLRAALRRQAVERVAWDTKSNWLFPSSRRPQQHLCPRRAQRAFRSLFIAAGIPTARYHSLRHTFATDLFIKTKNLELVRAVLGHRSIATTAVYLNTREQAEEAMETQ